MYKNSKTEKLDKVQTLGDSSFLNAVFAETKTVQRLSPVACAQDSEGSLW